MTPSASTRLLGIIGRGIPYTKSPKIHNALFEKNKLDFVYLKFDLEEKQLKNFLEIAWSIDAVGFNVTQPYKMKLAKLLDVKAFSPINTIFRGENCWEATSTDAIGFLEGLKRIKKEISDFDQIGWIGFGGAAVSILESVHQSSFRSEIFVRDILKVKENFGLLIKKSNSEVSELSNESLKSFVKNSTPRTLLIQATSAPLSGDNLSQFNESIIGFHGTFVDLIYENPSALYFECIRQNISCLDGEPMLIEQARASQKIWFGQALSYDEIQRLLRS